MNNETMPLEAKITNVKGDIIKFIELTARDYSVPAILMTGIISQVLVEWQKRELVEINDAYSKTLQALNKLVKKEDKNDV